MTVGARLRETPLGNFVNVEYGGSVYTCTSVEEGQWLVANSASSQSGEPSLFLFEDGEFRYARAINGPREPSLSETGRVILIFTCEPDEDEMGGVEVLDPDGSPVLVRRFDQYPLRVAITQDSSHVAVSIPPMTFILKPNIDEEPIRHRHVGGKKSGLSSGLLDGLPCFYLHDVPGQDPSYAIGPDGEIVWNAK